MTARNTNAARTLLVLGTALAALGLTLGSCVPWTVRRIQEEDQGKEADQRPFDPAAYVDTIWSAKLVPEILNSAVDARILLQALADAPEEAGRKYGRREGGSAYHFAVKGAGRALSVETRSRNGLLYLDIPPYDGQPEVSLQIGPVVLGSSLRDATGIVRFTDFVNQLQFADIGNELNRRVQEIVLGSVDRGSLEGRLIAFTGTFSLEPAGRPPIRDVIPVRLVVETER
jgi:predicted lipoprotein